MKRHGHTVLSNCAMRMMRNSFAARHTIYSSAAAAAAPQLTSHTLVVEGNSSANSISATCKRDTGGALDVCNDGQYRI